MGAVPIWAEAEIKARLAEERRNERRGARAFEKACAESDVEALDWAIGYLNENTVDGWRLAMMRVGRLSQVSPEIQEAFLPVWIMSKMLALQVGNRPAFARALRLLLPGGYDGEPLRLFRGTGWRERRRRVYGFSWTTRVDIARTFAEHWRQDESGGGGVILETLAPAGAVLLVRGDTDDDYNEAEVVVDPYALGAVSVAERLAQNCSKERPSSSPRTAAGRA